MTQTLPRTSEWAFQTSLSFARDSDDTVKQGVLTFQTVPDSQQVSLLSY